MLSSKWWNNKANNIKLVYLYSTIKTMHGPIYLRYKEELSIPTANPRLVQSPALSNCTPLSHSVRIYVFRILSQKQCCFPTRYKSEAAVFRNGVTTTPILGVSRKSDSSEPCVLQCCQITVSQQVANGRLITLTPVTVQFLFPLKVI